jgi:hypothetical protein
VRGGSGVSFVFPEVSGAAFSIYSIEGRLVTALPVPAGGAGREGLTWDARDMNGRRLSPGVYFCRLKADRAQVTRKFIVLR